MKVCLTRKYAVRIDGVDLSGRHDGDRIDLPQVEAELLVAEQWGLPDRRTASTPVLRERRADE
jgi:hypothetical protein